MTDELDEQRAAEIRLERAVADTLSADGWAENWEHAVTCARAAIPVAQAPLLARIAELEAALGNARGGWPFAVITPVSAAHAAVLSDLARRINDE